MEAVLDPELTSRRRPNLRNICILLNHIGSVHVMHYPLVRYAYLNGLNTVEGWQAR